MHAPLSGLTGSSHGNAYHCRSARSRDVLLHVNVINVTIFQWFGVTGAGGFAPLHSLWCFSFTCS